MVIHGPAVWNKHENISNTNAPSGDPECSIRSQLPPTSHIKTQRLPHPLPRLSNKKQLISPPQKKALHVRLNRMSTINKTSTDSIKQLDLHTIVPTIEMMSTDSLETSLTTYRNVMNELSL